MSENVYRMWNQKFPVPRNMCCHVPLVKRTIIATTIIHNISVLWNGDMPEGDIEEV
jgi:hypothetical protein